MKSVWIKEDFWIAKWIFEKKNIDREGMYEDNWEKLEK